MSPEPILPSVKSYPKSTDTKWARMGSWLLALLTFNFALLISACGLDIEDPTPPSPPVWVQKSLPEEWPERGIDAHESGGIYLEWESPIQEEISYYNIYRARYFTAIDSQAEYVNIAQLDVASLTKLEFVDEHTAVGMKYYYKINSEESSNNFSDYSDSICFTSLKAIRSGDMYPNGFTETLNSNGYLHWIYEYQIEMEDYCITILSEESELVKRVRFNPGNYTGHGQSWHLPNDINLEDGYHYKWRIDTGAKYVNGIETAASESPWATFVYTGP
jgi:hypothetical protein